MPTINEFISNFSGGARPNLFRVDLPFAGEAMKFLCKAAQIPGRTIGRVESRYLNNIIPLAGDTTFEPWTITIVNDVNYAIRTALENKMNSIKARHATTGVTDLSYMTDAYITQLNNNGEDVVTYQLFNAWPSNVASIDLSFDTADQIEEYQVILEYSHWERL